ncbi:MAG: metallophosphoesterase [Clostridia bacterium]|nr:metallophosphoesterase [Clostridia bacterium]
MSAVRIAALGDIHSNAEALRACLDEIDAFHPDALLFTGDYVSDCACPQDTIALLRGAAMRYDCFFIRGNREQYMLDYQLGKRAWRRGTNGGSLLYTYERLTADNLKAFSKMPAVCRLAYEDLPTILACHGAPDDLRGWLMDMPEQADQWLQREHAGIVVCAHTHRPGIMQIPHGIAVNTGTVGLPVDHPGYAAMAVLTGENGSWNAEILRVPFDAEKTIAAFDRDGFYDEAGFWPRIIARQLRFGGEQSIAMLEKAGALWNSDEPIPESIWQQAFDIVTGDERPHL